MENTKHIIWTWEIDLDEWDDLEEDYPNDDDRYEVAEEINYDYLEDEKFNLGITLPHSIVSVASLGLWNGRAFGIKELFSNELADCLEGNYDRPTWYVEGDEFCCENCHHDGTNYERFMMWKEDYDEDEKDEAICNAVYDKKIDDLMNMLVDIGDYVNKIYGW